MAVADQANRLADKTAFYNELALLDEDDDILDKGLQGSMQALSSAVIRKSRPVASPETMARDFAVETSTPASSLKMLGNMVTQTPVDPLRKSLARTLLRSNTGPEKTAAPSTPVADVEVVKDTPFRSQASTTQVPQLRHSISTPLPIKAVATSASATASTSKVLGKRKRLDTVKLVPEEQRIFSGLGFCKCLPYYFSIALSTNTLQSLFRTTTLLQQDVCESEKQSSTERQGLQSGTRQSLMSSWTKHFHIRMC